STHADASTPHRYTLFPTRRSSDLLTHIGGGAQRTAGPAVGARREFPNLEGEGRLRFGNEVIRRSRGYRQCRFTAQVGGDHRKRRSEEHTSELQSRENLVCRLLLEK